MRINAERIAHAFVRRMKLLNEGHTKVVEKMDEVEYNADLGLLAMEGLEIENGLYEDLSVQLVLTRASGRFFLSIDRAVDDQENIPEFKDETRVKGGGKVRHGFQWR